MNRKINYFIFMLIFIGGLSIPYKLFAQDFWIKPNDSFNEGVTSFVVNSNDDVFAGTGQGVFRSSDNGNNWILINDGLTISGIGSVGVSNLGINSRGDIFAGTYYGAFRLLNNSDTWTRTTLLSSNPPYFAINNEGYIFAGSWEGGVYRSIDNGDTWVEINNGLTNFDISSIAVDSSGNVFVGTQSGVFRSTNNGDNWFATGLSAYKIRSFAVNSQGIIYVGTDTGGLFYSDDNGNNWVQTGLSVYYLVSLAINLNDDIYVGSLNSGVFFSTDAAAEWSQINTGLNIGLVRSIIINNSGYIFAGGENGIARSKNSTFNPNIILTSPNGGENLQEGSAQNITWSSENVGNVLIEYTFDNDSTWTTIISSTESDGSYDWTIPNTPSTQCRVRISHVKDTQVFDESDGVFTIIASKQLIAFYPFNGDANDESGNGNNGSVNGATLTSDRFGNPNSAYNFGSGGYINVSDSPSLRMENSYSIVAWIKPEANQQDGARIISKALAIPNYHSYFLALNQGNQGDLLPNFGAYNNSYLNASSEVTANQWHQVIGVYDGKKTYIYVDGELSNQRDIQSNPPIGFDNLPLEIGRLNTNQSQYFSGCIDDIKIYNYAISQSKIDSLYIEGGWPNIHNNLVASYPFNGDANDESGNGNNGSVNGATLTSDRFGNPNSAFSFDGENDYIQIPHSESLNLTNQISVSYWIKLETSGPYFFPYHIIEKYGSWGSGQREWDINFVIDSGSVVWSTNLESETYYNFIMTYDGEVINIYKNSMLIGSESHSTGIPKSSSDIMIGEYFLGGDYYFDGIIDDIRIYNYALSESEIQNLYEEGGWGGTKIITLISPNGGENWEFGSTQEITWTSENVDNIKIEYSTNNGTSWTNIISSTPSDASYEWTIPNDASIECLVRISDVNDLQVFDVSEGVFTIEELNLNTRLVAYYPFNGNANDESGNGNNGTVNGATLTTDRVGNENKAYHLDGSTFISVPDDTSFTLETNPFTFSLWINLDQIGSYYIIGHDEGGGAARKWIFWFTGSSLGLHERLNGEYWIIEENWNPEINEWYYLNLVRDHNTFSIYVNTNLIGSNEDSRSIPDPNAPLRIGNAEGIDRMFKGKIDDIRIHKRALSIEEMIKLYNEGIGEEPSLSVIKPNGSETWQEGSTQNITWTSQNVDHVKIEYSINNGSSWTTIISSTLSDGSYEWTIPNNASSECLVRISDASDSQISDVSDGVFTIPGPLNPVVTITSPNGGEQWEIDSSMSITWTSQDVDNVKIEYSINNGSSWNTIISSTSSDGSYDWTIPNEPSSDCLARISDASNVQVSDISDATFSIIELAKSLTIISPNGGETWQGVKSKTVSWTGENIDVVAIEYSSNNGSTWTSVISSTPNDGSYSWTTPNIDSDNCLIKISDESVEDISDNTFSLFTYSSQINIVKSQSFGSITQNNYRMVSLPGNSNISISSTVTGENNTDWQAAYYNGATETSVKFDNSSAFRFSPGKGFWLLSRNGWSVNQTVTNVSLNDENAYSISLTRRWNIIASPFDKTIDWSSVQQLNNISGTIHYWEDSYSTSATLEPYKGYFYFNVDGRNSIQIPYLSNSTLSKVAISEKPIEINLINNGEEYSNIEIGFDNSSKQGYDILDQFIPPDIFDSERISILNNYIENKYKYLYKDFRNKDGLQDYDIVVKNKEAKNLSLMVENIEENIVNQEIYLIDKEVGHEYNLKLQNEISLNSSKEYSYFTLLIGIKELVNVERRKFLPTEFKLYQNYPNPFNPTTTIRFSLPSESNISLIIYNTLGEVVTTLISDTQYEQGNFEVEFDATKYNSGVYFYRLQSDKFNEVKKMILLK